MPDSDNSYKKVIKSTSLFGVIQVSNLAISMIRHKFFAVIIGPTGYGIFSLLYTTFDLVKQGAGFGLEVSGVKKISESQDEEAKGKGAALLIKLSIITGLLGTLILIGLSYKLSFLAFGNTNSAVIIVLISGSILLRQIISAQTAVMQGEGRMRFLAKTNLFGNLFSLIATLPLIYLFKTEAILPSILIFAIVNFIISSFYYNKMGIKKYVTNFKTSLKEGKEILVFGGLLSINGFLPLVANYVIQLYINHLSGISQVGFFNTGQLIINSYVGIIFTAMTMEYYPRLISLKKDQAKVGNAVSQQVVISILIIIPIMAAFLGFMPLIIRLLLSKKFVDVIPMLSWCILAMFFKSISWCIGYVIIARADSAVFLKTSAIFNALYILLCTGGYYLNGLEGLGMGFFTYYIVHFVAIYFIVKIRYNIVFQNDMLKMFALGLISCVFLLGINMTEATLSRQIIYIVFFILFSIFSVREIDKKIGIRTEIKKYLDKKNNRV